MKRLFKNNTFVLYAILPLIACFLFSCKKFLDKKPNSKLVVPATLVDAQALLDDATIMNQQRTSSFGEASSDEYFLKQSDYNALSSVSAIDLNEYIWSFYPVDGINNDWAYGYQPVYNANLALDLLKDIAKTSSNSDAWNNVKGSALFFRSYNFLWLLWDYAKAYDSTTADKDLGIALRLTSDFNIPSVRASNRQCYEQVIADAKAAIPLLPDYPQHVFRPSKGAAYGLLARCYLSMRDYKDALLYADSCLQLNNQLMDYNSNEDLNGSISASYPFTQFNKETVFYTEMNLCYSDLYHTAIHARMDTILYQSYEENDLRKLAYYSKSSDGYYSFKGSYGGSVYFFSGIATDEMYLTRAECFVRIGQKEKATDDVTALMSKRYAAGTYTLAAGITPGALLDTILDARKKELVMRGMRWMDIKRLNKESRNIILQRVENGQTYTLQPNADYYALPLPQSLIDITKMPQN
ncbi:hypothetical protein A9P82_05840 [Arachidicoccus ginsenosidimutans]|uniref:RagB/SusD family nutrient uptake outer membrane protein n=1 Tax=Arachidicoccus sp. BS20 TaxID=1850526 RepID=UPI0007F125BE|nr:RagB/SusD family nutrient uptake outer membrane protein [Arachidicoccus sp. BS20]ANI88852.1 hypothetical protein A9P82_05840 [Arachidicoccus sp. BS20]